MRSILEVQAKVQEILDQIKLVNYKHVFRYIAAGHGDVVHIHFTSYRKDNVSGEMGWQHGRLFVVKRTDSERSILRTALLAMLTFEEHELREQFTYRGQALYEPEHS